MNLRKQIETAINCASAENGSNTPDFILAEFLTDALSAFDKATAAREKWYGRDPGVGPSGIPTDGRQIAIDGPVSTQSL
jgi:hypothetical protein